MVRRYKEPELFGGQGVAASPRLCFDCAYRPIEYSHRPRPPGTPACTFMEVTDMSAAFDPLAARDVCKGDFWAPPSDLGARD